MCFACGINIYFNPFLDPAEIKEGDKVKQVNNGDKVRIPCDVTGEPTPTVTWFFKGISLDSSAKFVISGDHSITYVV